MSLVSVITVNFNNEKGLSRTIQSVCSQQEIECIEFVVVDGGSTDGSLEKIRNSPCVAKWVSEPDKGIYDAMNKGLKMASGDYVWFVNGGDLIFSETTVIELKKILVTNPDVVYGETMITDANHKLIGTRSKVTTRKLPEMLHWKSFQMGMSVGHQSFIVKRDIASEYNLKYKHVADIDWMISCLKKSQKVIQAPFILSVFEDGGYSSQNRLNSNFQRFFVLWHHYGILQTIKSHFFIFLRLLSKSIFRK